MKNSKKFVLVAASICALALGADRVNAVPTLTLFDGTTTITITDGSGLDANAAVGAVTFSGRIGVWDVNVSTGITKPVIGSSTVPMMDLNSVDHSTGAGTLTITFSVSPALNSGMPRLATMASICSRSSV